MTDQGTSRRGSRLLFLGAALVIIFWGINQAQSVLVLFLVSMFLAVLGTVPVRWMERKGIPSVSAVLLVVAVMVAFLFSAGVAVGTSVASFANALPLYQTRIHDMLFDIKVLLMGRGIAVTDEVLLGFVNPSAVMNLTTSLFSALGSVLSNVLLILFTAIFILLEASTFPARLRLALEIPDASFPWFAGFVNDLRRYMAIKTLINLAVGGLVTCWLAILGVDFPFLWGFLAFLLHYVPSIGSVVSAVPAVLLAFLQYGSGTAVLTAVGYIVIGTIIGNVVEPKIMGSRLGLSTLVVFLSLIVWGYLLGLVGALLCVPLTLTLKLFCEASEDTRWIAVLLGPEKIPEPAPAASESRA